MIYRQKKALMDDGLHIAYHLYGEYQPQKATLICLPGLTRNARGFDEYARHLRSQMDIHILALEMRGRGNSDYDPNPLNYNLIREVQDILTIIMQEQLSDILILGVSRGGMQAAMLAPYLKERLKGVILNDIGVTIPMAVMEALKALFLRESNFIGDYEMAKQDFYTLDRYMTQGLTPEQEYEIIHGLYKKNQQDQFLLDYDFQGMGIAYNQAYEGLLALNPDICDLRPLFMGLLHVPIMLLWGENSKLLTQNAVDETKILLPQTDICRVKNRGHCPFLNEPEAIKACDNFIKNYAH